MPVQLSRSIEILKVTSAPNVSEKRIDAGSSPVARPCSRKEPTEAQCLGGFVLNATFAPNVSERQIHGADSPDERLSSLWAVKEAKAKR